MSNTGQNETVNNESASLVPAPQDVSIFFRTKFDLSPAFKNLLVCREKKTSFFRFP